MTFRASSGGWGRSPGRMSSSGLFGSPVAREDLSSGWSSADVRWTYTPSLVSWAGGGGANSTTSKTYLTTSHIAKYVKLVFTISGYVGSNNIGVDAGVLSTLPNDVAGTGNIDTRVTANGTYTFYGYWRGGGAVNGRSLLLLGRGTADYSISIDSVTEWVP